jgi:hypothetical protein
MQPSIERSSSGDCRDPRTVATVYFLAVISIRVSKGSSDDQMALPEIGRPSDFCLSTFVDSLDNSVQACDQS